MTKEPTETEEPLTSAKCVDQDQNVSETINEEYQAVSNTQPNSAEAPVFSTSTSNISSPNQSFLDLGVDTVISELDQNYLSNEDLEIQ